MGKVAAMAFLLNGSETELFLCEEGAVKITLARFFFFLIMKMGCTQIPISTLSHTWVFVRLYGIVFIIIVIIIIIIMIIKSEGVNAQL